ncbi:uncharacterized protein LOC144420991 [Styela clava]
MTDCTTSSKNEAKSPSLRVLSPIPHLNPHFENFSESVQGNVDGIEKQIVSSENIDLFNSLPEDGAQRESLIEGFVNPTYEDEGFVVIGDDTNNDLHFSSSPIPIPESTESGGTVAASDYSVIHEPILSENFGPSNNQTSNNKSSSNEKFIHLFPSLLKNTPPLKQCDHQKIEEKVCESICANDKPDVIHEKNTKPPDKIISPNEITNEDENLEKTVFTVQPDINCFATEKEKGIDEIDIEFFPEVIKSKEISQNEVANEDGKSEETVFIVQPDIDCLATKKEKVSDETGVEFFPEVIKSKEISQNEVANEDGKPEETVFIVQPNIDCLAAKKEKGIDETDIEFFPELIKSKEISQNEVANEDENPEETVFIVQPDIDCLAAKKEKVSDETGVEFSIEVLKSRNVADQTVILSPVTHSPEIDSADVVKESSSDSYNEDGQDTICHEIDSAFQYLDDNFENECNTPNEEILSNENNCSDNSGTVLSSKSEASEGIPAISDIEQNKLPCCADCVQSDSLEAIEKDSTGVIENLDESTHAESIKDFTKLDTEDSIPTGNTDIGDQTDNKLISGVECNAKQENKVGSPILLGVELQNDYLLLADSKPDGSCSLENCNQETTDSPDDTSLDNESISDESVTLPGPKNHPDSDAFSANEQSANVEAGVVEKLKSSVQNDENDTTHNVEEKNVESVTFPSIEGKKDNVQPVGSESISNSTELETVVSTSFLTPQDCQMQTSLIDVESTTLSHSEQKSVEISETLYLNEDPSNESQERDLKLSKPASSVEEPTSMEGNISLSNSLKSNNRADSSPNDILEKSLNPNEDASTVRLDDKNCYDDDKEVEFRNEDASCEMNDEDELRMSEMEYSHDYFGHNTGQQLELDEMNSYIDDELLNCGELLSTTYKSNGGLSMKTENYEIIELKMSEESNFKLFSDDVILSEAASLENSIQSTQVSKPIQSTADNMTEAVSVSTSIMPSLVSSVCSTSDSDVANSSGAIKKISDDDDTPVVETQLFTKGERSCVSFIYHL